MSPARALKAALRRPTELYLAAHHAARGVPEAAILILGHMRSGSTLLLHLLTQSDEIFGAGERNTAFIHPRDVDRLARDCFVVERRLLGRPRYVVDQLNHDHLLPRPQLLLHPRIVPVLLARAPGPAIGSIVRTFEPLYGGWPPSRAARYYIERLATLAGYARRLRAAGRDPALVRYEALTAAPEPVLAGLRRRLDLARPLTPAYARARFTGRRGDPSPRIGAGRVRPDAGVAVPLEEGLAREAEAAYRGLLGAAGGASELGAGAGPPPVDALGRAGEGG